MDIFEIVDVLLESEIEIADGGIEEIAGLEGDSPPRPPPRRWDWDLERLAKVAAISAGGVLSTYYVATEV